MNRRCITVNLALQYLRHNKGRKGADKIKESREERKEDLETVKVRPSFCIIPAARQISLYEHIKKQSKPSEIIGIQS